MYITSPRSRQRIKLLLYESQGVGQNTLSGVPVHITFHGSGFVTPMLGSNGEFCALIARELGCIVIDADYRKAPRYPFPGAYDDAMSVVEWVLSDRSGRFDTSRVSVGGFSSGANLALAVCGSMPPGIIKGVIAFYPVTDFSETYADKRARLLTGDNSGTGILMPAFLGDVYRDAYIGDYTEEDDPRLSPIFTDPSLLPSRRRTFILSCEHDDLRVEADLLKDKLVQAGREPVYMFARGQSHGFDVNAKKGSRAATMRDVAFAKVVEVLRRAYTESG